MSVDRGKKNNKFIMEFGVGRNFVVVEKYPILRIGFATVHIITDQGKIPSVEVGKISSFLGWEQV